MKSQWMERNGLRSTFSVIFAASIFALFGCSATGKTVPFEKRIPLVTDSIQRGEQVVKDIKITYSYRLHQRTPDLSGLLEIGGKIRFYKSTGFVLPTVWIDFLDGEGKILERNLLRLSIWGRFQEKLEAPTGTVGISFAANMNRPT